MVLCVCACVTGVLLLPGRGFTMHAPLSVDCWQNSSAKLQGDACLLPCAHRPIQAVLKGSQADPRAVLAGVGYSTRAQAGDDKASVFVASATLAFASDEIELAKPLR